MVAGKTVEFDVVVLGTGLVWLVVGDTEVEFTFPLVLIFDIGVTKTLLTGAEELLVGTVTLVKFS